MARRTVKVLHVLGSTALTGALAAYMILLTTTSVDSLPEYALLRSHLAVISGWVILPSLVVVLVSGLFALAVHRPFQEARWVWVKLACGIPMFEGTLLTVDGTAQRAAKLTAEAVSGVSDPELVAELVRREWLGLWVIMGLALGNIVISVYRPRLRFKRAPAA